MDGFSDRLHQASLAAGAVGDHDPTTYEKLSDRQGETIGI